MRYGDPAQCALRCERDGRCRAWAFSYPLTESSTAVCWLKSRVPPRVAAPCCVSGVRGTGVIEPPSGRSWTYVRPGYVGPAPVCYLKNHITRPVRKACCISGVVR